MAHCISFVRIPSLAIRQHIRPLPRLGVLDGVAPGIVSPSMPGAIAQWNELIREKLQANAM